MPDKNYRHIILDPLANRDIIEEIKKHKVKKITLGMAHFNDPATEASYLSLPLEELVNLEGDRVKIEFTATNREHFNVEESVKVYKEADKSDRRIDIVFELTNGTKIKNKDLKLRRQIQVENDGSNNAKSDEIFGEMAAAYLGWVKDGYIPDIEAFQKFI